MVKNKHKPQKPPGRGQTGEQKENQAAEKSGFARYSFRHLARVTIQFTTPCHLGSGKAGDKVDAPIVTDANGLATIPGDGIIGALRAAYPKSERDDIFGHQDHGTNAGQGSRLAVTWGHVHGHDNRPVVGLLNRVTIAADPVLRAAQIPERRDHVRIAHRGAADRAQRGLFSEHCFCPGHRFTFELELASQTRDEVQVLKNLLNLLADPVVRFGGKTRRGLGSFKVVAANIKTFDLSGEKNDFLAYATHPASVREPVAFPSFTPTSSNGSAMKIVLDLHPSGFWLIGGGVDREDGADIAPLRGNRIHWKNNGGEVKPDQLVIPGTAIKGPLAHRSVYHYNRITGKFADEVAVDCANDLTGLGEADSRFRAVTGEQCLAARELFGMAKTEANNAEAGPAGVRGLVLIDDIYPDTSAQSRLVMHAPIGRFSGGVQNLFSEKPLWLGEALKVSIIIAEPNTVAAEARRALLEAIRDLAEGRLAIGAGKGRGEGFLQVDPTGAPWTPPENLVNWAQGDDGV